MQKMVPSIVAFSKYWKLSQNQPGDEHYGNVSRTVHRKRRMERIGKIDGKKLYAERISAMILTKLKKMRNIWRRKFELSSPSAL